jgi:NitT/TauT family transport system substrate-binding protein
MPPRRADHWQAADATPRPSAWRCCRVLPWTTLCLTTLAALCAGAQPTEPITLVLHWQHQAQFAGYYMALAKGAYQRQGLEVQVRRGGADVDGGQMLRAGQADFASFMLSSALQERAAGLPLRHLAQVVNRSSFLLVAWRDPASGGPIRELSDLDGRRVTVWPGTLRTPYLALFATQGIRPVVLPQYTSFSLFLNRGADAFAGMRYNEYHTLLQSGILEEQTRVFALRDYGMNLPEDGLYCLAETWQRRAPICRAFTLASLEGWRYARDHEEETLDVVMDYVSRDNLPTNRAHMRWMLKVMIAAVFPEPGDDWAMGQLSRPAYAQTVDVLTQYAGLQESPRYEDLVVDEVAHETR